MLAYSHLAGANCRTTASGLICSGTDSGTTSAFRDLQRAINEALTAFNAGPAIAEDGIIGPKTRDALNKVAPYLVNRKSPPPEIDPILIAPGQRAMADNAVALTAYIRSAIAPTSFTPVVAHIFQPSQRTGVRTFPSADAAQPSAQPAPGTDRSTAWQNEKKPVWPWIVGGVGAVAVLGIVIALLVRK